MIPDRNTSQFILPYPPAKAYKLFQGYCNNKGHRDRIAYDFYIPMGEEISCSRNGIVIEQVNKYLDTDNKAGHNNRVLVKHEDGTIAWYAHFQHESIIVNFGDSVYYGQVLGLSGTSGRSGSVPHVHFEVFQSKKYVYSDAIPISFRNIKGNVSKNGYLIAEELYEALEFNVKNF
ncbi:MAG: M23 family metallopeptidase [Ignavibacteriae bacterium]|nr:M23 family metallopeptidase [Ignavibacteriota bacterium]